MLGPNVNPHPTGMVPSLWRGAFKLAAEKLRLARARGMRMQEVLAQARAGRKYVEEIRPALQRSQATLQAFYRDGVHRTGGSG